MLAVTLKPAMDATLLDDGALFNDLDWFSTGFQTEFLFFARFLTVFD